MVEYEEGEDIEVTMHDGSMVILKKLERDYDPTDKQEAMRVLAEANECNCLITGLIYIDESQPSLVDLYDLPKTPLNRLPESRLRPKPDTLQQINDLMF